MHPELVRDPSDHARPLALVKQLKDHVNRAFPQLRRVLLRWCHSSPPFQVSEPPPRGDPVPMTPAAMDMAGSRHATAATSGGADLVVTSLHPQDSGNRGASTVALFAARLLRVDGILVVLTRCDWTAGELADPTGAVVTAGQKADLGYLQHIVAVHTPVRDGRSHLADPPPDHQTDGSGGSTGVRHGPRCLTHPRWTTELGAPRPQRPCRGRARPAPGHTHTRRPGAVTGQRESCSSPRLTPSGLRSVGTERSSTGREAPERGTSSTSTWRRRAAGDISPQR